VEDGLFNPADRPSAHQNKKNQAVSGSAIFNGTLLIEIPQKMAIKPY